MHRSRWSSVAGVSSGKAQSSLWMKDGAGSRSVPDLRFTSWRQVGLLNSEFGLLVRSSIYLTFMDCPSHKLQQSTQRHRCPFVQFGWEAKGPDRKLV